MEKNVKRKAVGRPKEADLPKYSRKERRKRFSKNISWDMYYQGKVRPVYFQGKVVNNPCQTCANNHYHSYGNENQCNRCEEYYYYRERSKIDDARIKLFDWLNRKGFYARPKQNYPFIEIDWERMGKKP